MHYANHTTNDFSFSKWYMDCVDAKGNVFIGYSAFLKWKKIKLNYASVLYHDNGGNIRTKTTLKKLPLPSFKRNCLIWSPSRLKVAGQWDSIDPPIKENLLNSDSGALDWRCVQPKSNAKILLPNQHAMTGLGYSEQVKMTVKPWKLPISELRWGRFLSEEDTIAWIHWKGEKNLTLVFYQGRPVKGAMITDEFISLNRGEFLLNFSDAAVLRKGYLISTALSDIPGVRDIFPKKILNTYECKWRSKGVLTKPNKPGSYGWVIHEVVKWNTKSA